MEPDLEFTILATLTAAIFLGTMAQLVAERFKLPAILPLLLFGALAGTSRIGFGLVQPDALDPVLEILIHLGVAVILFEGGLSLDLRQLAKVRGAVRNLLTIGVTVTAVGGAIVAHWATGIPWSTAALFGAIVTVTGPTVIAPLLRHMIAPREVKTVLLSEGLIIDPIGVVLAYLVLQWIERAGVPFKEIGFELVALALTGGAVGYLAGALARWLTSSRFCSRELRNLAVLAILMLGYLISENQAHQSGVLMAVVMGMTVSAGKIPDLEPLKAFKEQLTTLVISVLFILLSAQLDLTAMIALGWGGVAVVVGLTFLVRPLAVMLSVHGEQHLGAKERILLAMTAPRGIVAAAFASLAARQLHRAGIAGGAMLEGLVYLVILATGAWATLMAVVLPHWLGYRGDPSRRLTVLVGASPLTISLAALLTARGRKAVILDASRSRVAAARLQGARAQMGDARDAASYERIGVESDASVLALTPNDELNLLIAELVRDEFGIDHPVISLQQPSEEFGVKRRAWIDQLGERPVALPRWSQRLESDQAEILTVPVADESAREQVQDYAQEHPAAVVLLCGWKGDLPRFGKVMENLASFDEVSLLVSKAEASEPLQAIARAAAAASEQAGEATAGGSGAPLGGPAAEPVAS